MYYRRKNKDKDQDKFCRPDMWSNIDPTKVKQRIDRITQRLERVRRQFESDEANNSALDS
ncbi:hypothetical protein H6F96_09570 [Microcoleus sp. FACHB-53]|nr:hypothetical protein [Microcoleus sp. FACHB-53]